ncbi:hypothetical protein FB451DRAFT_1223923 [Mycena latifolia]|nr:hypothetical protein FB451DRAFT_1223923 [Mycena latifolia]
MRYIIFFFLLTFCKVQLALASLYPTHPTADTIFNAGTEVSLKWIDSFHHPRLTEMGSLKIELRTTDDIYAATLATGVSPMPRTHTVVIPENLTHAGPYVILFISIYPPMKIWTADFGIIPAVTDATLPYIPQLDDTNVTHPRLTIVLPSATIVSELAPTTKFAAATTISAGPLPAGGGAGTGLNRVHSPSSANPRQGSGFQHAKFRLMFIVWPALIGISMAL